MPFTQKDKLEFTVNCLLGASELYERIDHIVFNLFRSGLPEDTRPDVLAKTTSSCSISMVLTPNIVEISMQKHVDKPLMLIIVTARLEFLMLYFRVESLHQLEEAMRPWFEGAFAKQTTQVLV